MDPRCSIDKFVSLNVGSKTGELVMQSRNAGGNIRFAIRDILLIDRQFGLDEVVVVHHTDCGSLTFTNKGLRDAVKERIDSAHWDEVDKIDWGANTDMAASVKGDLEWLRATPLIRDELKLNARGFLFDIQTGEAEEIKLA
ncbi:uncharacterized protein B0I36DRAFT_284622 [Microdochium trichocladiopsis]|uniref:Carbonic anhydrase n=1 Tax=Microdochium trichocladiopsis TaxID=1682393 RepID=A0A9P9BS97_9PEZI|nr:uncharacterized protein B0I36DRAFT_284622 [Microdochium trichocladiopsis]KAH7034515.1 hypothetical protein B0I36DRAFT_284622 [Microdochium trichocladiopsis]